MSLSLTAVLTRRQIDSRLSETRLFNDRLTSRLYTRQLNFPSSCRAGRIAFSPGNQSWVTMSGWEHLHLWRTQELWEKQADCHPLATLNYGTRDHNVGVYQILAVTFDCPAERIFSRGRGGILIHDLTTSQLVQFRQSPTHITKVSNHPENKFLYSTTSYGISLSDLRSVSDPATTVAQQFDRGYFCSVDFNESQPFQLVSGHVDEGFHLWDLRNPLKPTCKLGRGGRSASSAKFDRTGRRVLTHRSGRFQPILYEIHSDSTVTTTCLNRDRIFVDTGVDSCSFAGLNDEYVVAVDEDLLTVCIWRIPVTINDNSFSDENVQLREEADVTLTSDTYVEEVQFHRGNHAFVASSFDRSGSFIKIWSPWRYPSQHDNTDEEGTDVNPTSDSTAAEVMAT